MQLPAELQRSTWTKISAGMSGAAIFRGTHNQQDCFLKVVPHTHRHPVRNEYQRLNWLQGRFPAAQILHYSEDHKHQFLLTTAVPGVALFDTASDMETVITRYATIIRDLHNYPIADCPFISTIEDQIAFARTQRDSYSPDSSLLDPEFQGRSFAQLFQELLKYKPTASDPVLIHGDPYNDNILVDPQTGQLTGLIDVGHLAVADRYTDLAMIYDDVLDTYGETAWQRFLSLYSLPELDTPRMYFYRIFNEFM